MQNYYYFIATFEDGTQIFQDENDTSTLVPTKSQFYDVLEKGKDSPLQCLVLKGENENLPTFGVDLRDGHFEVNGVPFFQHRFDRETLTDFRIIYYRNVAQTMSSDGTQSTSLGYTLGWQTELDGKNIQKIIKI